MTYTPEKDEVVFIKPLKGKDGFRAVIVSFDQWAEEVTVRSLRKGPKGTPTYHFSEILLTEDLTKVRALEQYHAYKDDTVHLEDVGQDASEQEFDDDDEEGHYDHYDRFSDPMEDRGIQVRVGCRFCGFYETTYVRDPCFIDGWGGAKSHLKGIHWSRGCMMEPTTVGDDYADGCARTEGDITPLLEAEAYQRERLCR